MIVLIWVCPICATSNEDSATHCYICDCARPRSADRAKKRANRIAVAEKFMKVATVLGKTLFIFLLCVAFLCVVGRITFKIIDKEIQSLLDNLLYVLKGWGNVLKITFTDNALAIGKAFIDEPLICVYKNFLGVMKHFGGSFKDFGLSLWEMLKHFGGNFKDLGASIAAISIVVWGHFKDFWEILSKVAVKCWSHLKDGWNIIKEVGLRIADNAKDFYKRIKDLFA